METLCFKDDDRAVVYCLFFFFFLLLISFKGAMNYLLLAVYCQNFFGNALKFSHTPTQKFKNDGKLTISTMYMHRYMHR